MKIHDLKPNARKRRTRVGHGDGSGKGSFSGRGCKGQNSRAGGGVRPGFEGGQSGLLDRMPKLRGFKNPNRVEAQILNLDTLEENYKDGEKVSLETLIEKNLIRKNNAKVKILGDGTLTKKLEVAEGILLSASAKKALS